MKKQDGFAIIAALLILVAVTILVWGTAFTSIIDRQISSNQRGAIDAYYIAKAGVDKYKTIAFQTYRYYLSHPEKYKAEIQKGNPACGNYLSIGLDLNRDGVIDSKDFQDGKTYGPYTEGKGSYTVKYEVAGRYVVLTSVGKVGRSRSTVQIVAEPSNAGLFDQALFAGPGQSSTFLNGGVEIRGGMYIEGNPTNPNQYVIDSNGNFAQYNYYSKADLASILSASNITTDDLKNFLNLNFLEQKDMCAHLRVKDGKIRLNGSATAGGAPNNPAAPTGFKTNLEGVEVKSGLTDIAGSDRVHADIVRDFDLSKVPKFPKLDDPSLPLNPECNTTGATSWRDCLHKYGKQKDDVADTRQGGLLTMQPDGTSRYEYTKCSNCNKPSEVVTVYPSGNGCNYSTLLSGNTLIFGNISTPDVNDVTNNIKCAIDVDSDGTPDVGFSYNANGVNNKGVGVGDLVVYGVNNFKGLNLQFNKSVQVRFENKASFFVEGLKDITKPDEVYSKDSPPNYTLMQGGNVLIKGDILPKGGCKPDVTPCEKMTFPNDSVLGFITDNMFRMSGDTQQGSTVKEQVALGLFYAGNSANIESGSIVFGSVLAPSFSFSSGNAGQKSKLIYVPGLTYGSAPGFNTINDPSNPTFRIASFERR